jgi:dihydropyrimidine dehydrogenase (NAD+) subunit PreT
MSEKYLKEYEAGYNPKLVMEEATRCLLCHDAPCSKACPAGTDPAKFIRSVRFKNVKGAAETVRINNILGAICARVCPTERYCQQGCSRSGIDKPIDIGRIQRFVTDSEDAFKMNILEAKPLNGKKIAVIGSGPAGLSVAGLLAMDGYKVVIFEKEAKAGGYLRYGIPEYRLPTEVVDKEIKRIQKLGVEILLNSPVEDLEALKKEYDAVVVAVGHSKGKVLPIFAGKRFVKTAVDFLHEAKRRKGNIKVPENVLVIGGGDVAMDTVTTLKLLGVPHVTDVVYETFAEFKASKKELQGAQQESVSIIDGYVPVALKGKKVVFNHRYIPAKLEVKADLILLAVGQYTEAGLLGFEVNKLQEVTNAGGKVFVCGDVAPNGEKTVVYAVRSAKEVAYSVKKYLGGK